MSVFDVLQSGREAPSTDCVADASNRRVNFRGVLIAVIGVSLETQVDDPGQGGGNIGIELSWRDRNLLHDRDQELVR